MPYIVAIDPGHGGRDPGAVSEGRQEKDDVLRLALTVGALLEQNGIDVVYTRTTDVYNTPFEKATMANNSGADLFVSFHRNATPSGEASGAEVLVYEDAGLPAELARNILDELEQVGFIDRGVIERKNLVVLRRTQMPSVLIETGFIDNQADNELFDQEFDSIAEGIADAILDTISDVETPDQPLYRVQVGAYRENRYAYAQLQQLLAQGFPAFIIYENGLYKVQVGAFAQLSIAVRMEQDLRMMGYNTYITT
ncbi:MAG: N-acetylmuramoyl-L-alanine amidase [Lachnospiraceae bacterium]|nr:N-acetylmuramoyl-L-alanine amidase [Lachnospiraceae bacterium]